jgi:hypothetical protein
MSLIITAQAIPTVASSDWGIINEHLFRRHGDWSILRGGLIHMVCARVSFEGDPVSRLEEYLLLEFYKNLTLHIGFPEALKLVRAEINAWPAGVSNLLEHLLAQNPDFPIGTSSFHFDFDLLCKSAPKARSSINPPTRSLDKFRKSSQNSPTLQEVSK